MRLEGPQLDQHRLLRLLATGGSSDTYLAETMTAPPHFVAIKVFPWTHDPSSTPVAQEAEQRFFRQVEAISRLQHLSIVPIHDSGQTTLCENRYFYIIMPFFPEGSLAEWWRRRRDSRAELLSPQEVAPMIQQAAEALQYAHDRHIIHQHLQLSNFLVPSKTNSSNLPEVLLTDFVTAEFGRLCLSLMTRPLSFWSTISPYVAPEQLRGNAVPASDQYALASVAYQLLTGQPSVPLQRMPEFQIFFAPSQPPSIFQPHLPPALDAVLLHALKKKPEERFASIVDFSCAFQQALHV